VSLRLSNRRGRKQDVRAAFDRAQGAVAQGVDVAQRGASAAAERIGPAARQTREVTADRLLAARAWSAPRLESASKYVESDLGPKVSAVLADTAKRVEPADPKRGRVRRVMFAGLAVAAFAGVVGMIRTRRAQTASFDESTTEPEPVTGSPNSADGARASS
jgi:hypothetical protein